MLLLLPIAAYGLLWFTQKRRNQDWRGAALSAATLWGAFLVYSTETLSVPNWITLRAVALIWIVFCAAIVLFLRFVLAKTQRIPPTSRANEEPMLGKEWRFYLAGTGVVVSLVGLTALLSPPNTRDSMQYHMPRIVEWVTYHSVRFFPTFDYQQLTMPPFAEYAMLHMYLLTGGDHFVNLAQWFAYLGSIVGVSSIARELGAGRLGQVLAAVSCATIPTGILGASGSKNDVVMTFWIVVCIFYLLLWRKHPNHENILYFGVSLGLACFTKGTAFIYLPFILFACWLMLPSALRLRFLRSVPLVAMLLLSLNAPQFVRNYELSGSPLGFASPDGEADVQGKRRFGNGTLAPSAIAANVVRNSVLHLGTPSSLVNSSIEQFAVGLIHVLGNDPNDSRMTAGGKTGLSYPFAVPSMARTETQSGNLIHFLFAALVLAFLVVEFRKIPRDVLLFTAGLLSSFVMFCALIRWMPFNARLHLPVFVLGSAVLGSLAPKLISRRTAAAVCAALLLASMPFVLSNKSRPLVAFASRHDTSHIAEVYGERSIVTRSRDDLYFGDAMLESKPATLALVNRLSGSTCRDIGVDATWQHYTYQILALLREQTPNVRLRYVGVTNRSAAYQRPELQFPCAVICFTCAREPRKWAEYSSLSASVTVIGEAVIFEGRNQYQDGTPAAATFQTQPVTPASGRGPEPSRGKS